MCLCTCTFAVRKWTAAVLEFVTSWSTYCWASESRACDFQTDNVTLLFSPLNQSWKSALQIWFKSTTVPRLHTARRVVCRCHDVMVGRGRYRLGLLWKRYPALSLVVASVVLTMRKVSLRTCSLQLFHSLNVTNVIHFFNPGSIYNKDLSPKYKQQRQHLLGHPAVTVVSSTDGV